jgi:hypothetical protein
MHAAKPVNVDKDGRLICTRCGEPITTRVMEIAQQPYDTVCHRLEQMGGEEIKMPGTSVAEPPMTRSYINRKGERELAVSGILRDIHYLVIEFGLTLGNRQKERRI